MCDDHVDEKTKKAMQHRIIECPLLPYLVLFRRPYYGQSCASGRRIQQIDQQPLAPSVNEQIKKSSKGFLYQQEILSYTTRVQYHYKLQVVNLVFLNPITAQHNYSTQAVPRDNM